MPAANPFKSLQKIHTAMLAGMVLFCVVSAVVRIPSKLANNPTFDRVLQVTLLALAFVCIKTGLTIFDRRIQGLGPDKKAMEKMDVYRVAAIIKWALIEAPVLLSIVSFMLTRNYAYIAFAFALIIFFAFQGPNKLKVMMQLHLSGQEAEALERLSK